MRKTTEKRLREIERGEVRITATGSTTARALRDRAADVVNVKDFGATGDGTTNDTAAFTAAAAAVGGNKFGTIYAPKGIYKAHVSLPAWCSLKGDGWLNTHIRPVDNDQSVILLDRATSSAFGFQNEIRDLHVWGNSTGAGHGIEGTGVYASAIGPSGLSVRRVYLDSLGGDGLHLDEAWNATFENVQASNNLGHQFFIDYAINTVVFISCYPRGIPTSGKAGWRVNEGRVTLINCNGVDTGDYWGVFGGELSDGDSRDANAFVHVIGGNVESAAVAGLWIKRNSQAQIDSTSFVANVSGTSKAITFHNFNNNNPITIGGSVTFSGTWANSNPLHAWTVPGYIKWGIGLTTVWSDQFSASSALPNLYATDGSGVVRFSSGIALGTSNVANITTGTGAPSFDAPVGTLYLRTDGGVGTSLYVKEAAGAGAGNWGAK